jgi:ankyrin repeat protein
MQKNLKEGEITMKRIAVILILVNVCNLKGMQSPSKITGKRRAEDTTQQPIAKVMASQKQKGALPDLALELQTKILNFILNVSGPTNEAKLYKAADNLRNYMMINKSYYEWLNTPFTVNSIIRELAKRYTVDNDFIAVVLALGTNSASKWLATRVSDALVPNDQGMLGFANDRAKDFIVRLSEYLRVVFVNSQIDKFDLLTKNVEPLKKAWLLNNLMIYGLPLLSYLIVNNRSKLLDLLLAVNGIDLEVSGARGDTPLITAIKAKNMPALQKLIEQGAQLNVLNEEEKTPLMVAIEEQNEPAVTELVNNANVDLNAGDLTDDTPLHKAVEVGNENIFDLLLKVGVPNRLDINARGNNGDTALMMSAARTDMYFVDGLLRSGAHVNAKNDHEETALMFAAQNENNGHLMLLIEHGANLNEVDSEGHTALWHARNKNMQQNIRSLERAGARE